MPCWPTRRGNKKQKRLTLSQTASRQVAVKAVRDQKSTPRARNLGQHASSHPSRVTDPLRSNPREKCGLGPAVSIASRRPDRKLPRSRSGPRVWHRTARFWSATGVATASRQWVSPASSGRSAPRPIRVGKTCLAVAELFCERTLCARCAHLSRLGLTSMQCWRAPLP